MNTSAKFISFEGGEGAGKTTQIHLLEHALKAADMPVIVTREPGGTVGAELLRNALQHNKEAHWDAVSQLLILYAARRDLVEKVIKPALARNTWVLCDRFADSSFVYQGYAQGLGVEFVKTIHEIVLHNFQPDLTFFFDIPPEQGLKRIKERSTSSLKSELYDRFEEQDLEFHQKIYQGFRMLAHGNKRFVNIQANLPLDQVSPQIFRALGERFHITL